jgi:HupE / UreJ protein
MIRLLGLILVALLVSSSAAAHEVGLSHGTYRARASGLAAEIVLARGEAMTLVPELDENHDGVVTESELAAARTELGSRVLEGIRVVADGRVCTSELVRAELTDSDGLSLQSRHTCSESARVFDVTIAFIDQLARGHRHAARLVSETDSRDELLFGEQRSFSLPVGSKEHSEAPSSMFGFVRMGAEHIAGGYDHVLFLLALVLAGGGARTLLGIVTAFTLGHSLTLAISALGIWTPPSRLIEPLIALSVAFVAIENFTHRNPRTRWRVALPFGLIHGFGFAGALIEAKLPSEDLLGALFSFNLGVELGQLGFMAFLLPLVAAFRRSSWFPRFAVPALSGLILLVSVGWFIERVSV